MIIGAKIAQKYKDFYNFATKICDYTFKMETNYMKTYPLSISTACVIICLSLCPFQELPKVDVPFADKWTHMVMYGVFCLIIWFEYLRSHHRIQTGKITLYGWLCPIVMSGLLELAQEGVSRIPAVAENGWTCWPMP